MFRLWWILMIGLFLVMGCSSERLWSKTDDSCIYESEEPPLQRVVNYADPTLCHRGLPHNAYVPKPVRTAPKRELR